MLIITNPGNLPGFQKRLKMKNYTVKNISNPTKKSGKEKGQSCGLWVRQNNDHSFMLSSTGWF